MTLTFPTIKFREEQQESRKVIENWFNRGKPKQNIGVEPIKRKEEGVKVETPKENKHPWDITHEIIQGQNNVALAIKWSAIPTVTLFDEQCSTCNRRDNRHLTFEGCGHKSSKGHL